MGPGNVGGFTHLGRLALRLLLRFHPLGSRHDLNLSQGPLLPFLGASFVEDTVAELDAVLLENKEGKKAESDGDRKG